jgi:putative oxidoreductase
MSVNFLPLAARILLAAVFIVAGALKFPHFDETAQFMAAKGMPMAETMLWGAIAVELLGGASLLLGLNARIGALVLAAFLVPTTLMFHNFWAVEDAMARQNDMYSFLKNLAIMGGLLMVVIHGAGPLSLDNVIGRRDTPPPV